MKYAIGSIFFGLLLRYGSADVSHLAKPHHSQYLPPANRNLPIEKDYNGIDSHHNDGYLPPDNGNQNGNHGYLPPHQAQNHHQHSYRDHHNHHDHQDHQHHHGHQDHRDDHSQNHHHDQQQHHDHHDHSQSHRNDQQHQHDHQPNFHHSDHHNHQDYDPSVQVSYHNDYAVNEKHDRQHTHNDHGQDNHQGNYDNSYNDHVDIDQQQLDPVLPSSLPVQSYLPPTQVGDQVNPSQVARHQNSVYNNPRSFNPAHSTSQQVSSSSQNGYDYSPPAIQPAESLYPNQVGHTNNAGPLVADGHQHLHQDSPQPSHVDHTAPNNSNQGHHGVSNQGYLPPRQSSHGNPGVLGHSSGQDYLPPTELNHGNPTSPQQEQLAPTQQSHQDYLPPSQGNHQVYHSNHAGPGGSHEHGYLPPPQPPHQSYHPPNQGNQGSHLNHASPTGLQQINNAQEYLPPSHEHHAPLQAPQQDYLPPSHSNHGSSGNLPFLDDHTGQAHHESTHLPQSQSHHVASTNLPFLNDQPGHTQQESTHLPRNHVSSTNLPFLDDLRGHGQQEPQPNYFNPTPSGHTHDSGLEEPHPDYLPPTQSNFGSRTNGRQNQQQNAQDLPNSSQLGSLHHDDELKARSRLTVRGHVNVPLPIPQVGYFFLPGTVSRIPSLNTGKSEEGLRPALNIPALIGPHATQPFSSPEYERTFHLPNTNRPADKRSSEFSIVPSIQTQQDHQVQQNPQNEGQHILSDLPFLPQSQNGAYHHVDQQFTSPDDLSNRGLSLQSIARSQVTTQQTQISQPQDRSQFRGSSYLPPPRPLHSDQHDHTHNQAQPQIQQQTHHHQNTQTDSGYLPPDSQNQVTSLQTYMNAVDPSDRYGSSQYHNPPPRQKGAPSPPATTSPPMYSKPSAVVSYAPGIAYKVSTNTPFNTFHPAAYLPALDSPVPEQDHSSLSVQLHEAAMKNLAKIMPKDNTVFPLEELLDIQDADDIQNGDDIDSPQLRGRVRTVQIINNHANSVKNIKVLETADQDGVKTIKILGPSNEDPMGDHKIVHIVSKGSNPEGIRQTIKIFADHKEVSLPTQNAYLPPPAKATDSKVRKSRRSKEDYRKH